MYAGGLPYEGYMIDLILKREFEVLNTQIENFIIYCYMVIFLILVILGVVLQIKQNSMDESVKKLKALKSSFRKKQHRLLIGHAQKNQL